MNGKLLLTFVLTHIATNGFWFVYVRRIENDMLLIPPAAATVGLLYILIFHCMENWHK